MASPEDEKEAMNRCLNAGYTLEMEARNLTSFPADDHRPLWRAHYLREVVAERQREAARTKAIASMLLVSSPALGTAFFNLFAGWWR